MFSKKVTKIDEIFTVDFMKCNKCQIEGEDFVTFRGLPRTYELYPIQQFAVLTRSVCTVKGVYHSTIKHINS